VPKTQLEIPSIGSERKTNFRIRLRFFDPGVWVGLIAVGGVAAQTGIIVVVYLDEAFQHARSEGRVGKPEDVDAGSAQ
jgi:hypothetical protein